VLVDEAFAGFAECNVGIGNVAGLWNTDPPGGGSTAKRLRPAAPPDSGLRFRFVTSSASTFGRECWCLRHMLYVVSEEIDLDPRGEIAAGERYELIRPGRELRRAARAIGFVT
jgi:hypothetical protein